MHGYTAVGFASSSYARNHNRRLRFIKGRCVSSSFDLAVFERDFLASCMDGVRFLAKTVTASPFYALSIYVDAFDGNFGLYANTEADFQKTLREYQEEYPEDYTETIRVKELKYNCADWEYQSIVLTDEFGAIVQSRIEPWSSLALQLIDTDKWFPSEKNYLLDEIGCRIAASSELARELEALKQTDDFLVTVSTHDEPSLASVYRPMWYADNGSLHAFNPMIF